MVRLLIAAAAFVPCVLLLLPAAAAALVLHVFAAAVRAIGRLLEAPFVPWTELIAFDPGLGWKPRAGVDTHYLAERDDVFRIVTDAEGWPGRRSLDASELVVIGDSFAFGYGVDTGRSFAEIDAGLGVKSIGALGYSLVHGVLLMEQLAQRLSGKLVVWFAYLENDLQDNLAPEMRGYRAPFVRPCGGPGDWEIVSSHLAPARWTSSKLDSRRLFPAFCVPGPLADRAYSACDYLIRRAKAACEQAGAHLVIVTVPHPMQLTASGRAELAASSGSPDAFDAALPDRRVAESCRRHRVPLVVGADHLSRSDYKRREGIHWNERGHRRISRVLAELDTSFRSGRLEEYIPHRASETSHSAARPGTYGPAPAHSPAARSLGAGR